jgi:hypothetical protein
METLPKSFPNEQFELLVRSYIDNLVDWDVVHNFAMAHIDDVHLPEFQRPMEDLHLMFLPEVRHDAESVHERPQIRFLLDLLDLLKSEVEQYGVETIRDREMQVMAGEDPSKHEHRREFRDRHRNRRNNK